MLENSIHMNKVFFFFIYIEEVDYVEVKTGYIYHIKDEFFDVVNDDSLMSNHERGKKDQLILQLKIKIFYGLFS